jgi:hypothetical protein
MCHVFVSDDILRNYAWESSQIARNGNNFHDIRSLAIVILRRKTTKGKYFATLSVEASKK